MTEKKEFDTLTQLRIEIDLADQELFTALAKRMTIARLIGEHKAKQGIKPLDQARWQAVIESRVIMGEKNGIPKEVTIELMETIHKLSLDIQESILTQEE